VKGIQFRSLDEAQRNPEFEKLPHYAALHAGYLLSQSHEEYLFFKTLCLCGFVRENSVDVNVAAYLALFA
jgi:hypothetical protein